MSNFCIQKEYFFNIKVEKSGKKIFVEQIYFFERSIKKVITMFSTIKLLEMNIFPV